MNNFLITLGIIFLAFNTLRFLLGNYNVFRNKNFHPVAKWINLVESVVINLTLAFLIYFYHTHK